MYYNPDIEKMMRNKKTHSMGKLVCVTEQHFVSISFSIHQSGISGFCVFKIRAVPTDHKQVKKIET